MKQEQFIRIRVKLMEQLRQGAEWSDEEILERIDLLVSETARENRLTVKQREEIRRELFYSVRKLDILQELVDDKTVSEIMVNGAGKIFTDIPISSKFLSPRTNSTTVIWLWISAVWIK